MLNVTFEDVILQHPIELDDHNQQHKGKLLQHFDENYGKQSGYNVLYDDEDYFALPKKLFNEAIEYHFEVSQPSAPAIGYVYCQNDVRSDNVWHNHFEGSLDDPAIPHLLGNPNPPSYCNIYTRNITATYYIDPPQSGGQFQAELNGEIKSYYVTSDTMLLFPDWLNHRPAPQQSKENRICVTLQYTVKGPVYCKTTDTYW